MCHSWEDRERWEQMLAREADEERIRLIEAEQAKPQEPEPERADPRAGALTRLSRSSGLLSAPGGRGRPSLSGDRQKQIDLVSPAVKLDTWPGFVYLCLLDEHLERRRDLVVHIRGLAPKALAEVTAAGEH